MSDLVPIKIRHAGKLYDAEVDLNEPGILFKSQIFSLTNVPPERQKVLVKGGKLEDDTDLKSLNLKPNQTIMVLGTPDAQGVPQKPKEKMIFLEDLEKEGKLVYFSGDPLGLQNLGNTCYMNSTLQVLNNIPDLSDALKSYIGNDKLTKELKSTFDRLVKGKVSGNGKFIIPLSFVKSLRESYPQFLEQDEFGYKQQDAEEALSQILSSLKVSLPNDYIDKNFGIEFNSYQNCLENDPEDKETVKKLTDYKLICNISSDVNHLKDGLVKGSKETVEKMNPNLNVTCSYSIERKITKLPRFLTVQFVRFFYKRDIRAKAKILRKVSFPFQLDVTDLLDETIKAQNLDTKEKIYQLEKKKEDEYKENRKLKKLKMDASIAHLSNKEIYEKEEAEFQEYKKKWLTEFATVFPENLSEGQAPSPLYELTSIITHKGASADSGHYQAFTKNEKDATGNSWWQFNDDKVTAVSREKIESLFGGGESDIALVLIYKALGL